MRKHYRAAVHIKCLPFVLNAAKVMLHEWAHYRYGVFDEYGYPYDEKFNYTFSNVNGVKQLTSCNDSAIEGTLVTT